MSFYRESICPCLTHLAMSAGRLRPYREAVTRQASGRVLEIGVGSGANLGFYGSSVESVVGIDPSAAMLRRAAGVDTNIPVMLRQSAGEALPLESGSFDCVVSAWTLCSVSDAHLVLQEISRVLKPGGHFLYVEHGRSPDDNVSRWQDRLNPVWRRFAGGCNINRPISKLVAESSFHVISDNNAYASGPRLFAYFYQGDVVR
ncbi:class I SAM-dependent methyltransferase [Jiella pacifica]|uniref:Methyltransferase domain-containing protein n=1 Tax=Jiella pacifica TaxID=2696469 RepID=A0A6N9TDV8_9HYPH|nr:class I SAM-dependent methyltransferase [Jiella pacifica]NDW07859.1 methyltransferase domain-containing protein [Jiella pacifica]